MMKQYQSNSYLFGGNAPYVEELYENYLDNPGSVPEKWREYFDALQVVPANAGADAGREHVDAVPDGLREGVGPAGEVELGVELVDIATDQGARLPGSRRIALRETARNAQISVDARLLADVEAIAARKQA
jgi:2-oxoglutarate dehydrogenase complex dehydrogenase (E1) component-like enzyme